MSPGDIDYNLVWYSCDHIYRRDSIRKVTDTYTWEFNKDKTKLIFFNPNIGSRSEYEILQLKEREIKLRKVEGMPPVTSLFTLSKVK
jgi:hypothetical protein